MLVSDGTEILSVDSKLYSVDNPPYALENTVDKGYAILPAKCFPDYGKVRICFQITEYQQEAVIFSNLKNFEGVGFKGIVIEASKVTNRGFVITCLVYNGGDPAIFSMSKSISANYMLYTLDFEYKTNNTGVLSLYLKEIDEGGSGALIERIDITSERLVAYMADLDKRYSIKLFYDSNYSTNVWFKGTYRSIRFYDSIGKMTHAYYFNTGSNSLTIKDNISSAHGVCVGGVKQKSIGTTTQKILTHGEIQYVGDGNKLIQTYGITFHEGGNTRFKAGVLKNNDAKTELWLPNLYGVDLYDFGVVYGEFHGNPDRINLKQTIADSRIIIKNYSHWQSIIKDGKWVIGVEWLSNGTTGTDREGTVLGISDNTNKYIQFYFEQNETLLRLTSNTYTSGSIVTLNTTNGHHYYSVLVSSIEGDHKLLKWYNADITAKDKTLTYIGQIAYNFVNLPSNFAFGNLKHNSSWGAGLNGDIFSGIILRIDDGSNAAFTGDNQMNAVSCLYNNGKPI